MDANDKRSKVMINANRVMLPTLSEGIQKFIHTFFFYLGNLPCDYLVLRDFEGLPKKVGFDLDVLVEKVILDDISNILTKTAKDFGAFVSIRPKGQGLKAFVMDIKADRNVRSWVYFDFQSQIAVNKELVWTVRDIGTERYENEGLSIVIPNASWALVLGFVQNLRKGRCLEGVRKKLAQGFPTGSVPDVFVKIAGHAKHDTVSGAEWAEQMRDILGVRLYRKKYRTIEGLRGKIARFIFQHFYFIRLSSPAMFAISGPDGVGKSTMIHNMFEILAGVPIEFDVAHHTTYLKTGGNQKTKEPIPGIDFSNPKEKKADFDLLIAKKGPTPSIQRSSLYRILRSIWRKFTPVFVKVQLNTAWIEVLYARILNNLIFRDHYARKVLVFDRYVYDRYLKFSMLNKPFMQKMTSWLNSIFMHKPALLILLEDTPNKVYARKQELDPEQIARFQSCIVDIARRRNVDFVRIDVSEYSQQELAEEVTRIILHKLGASVFDYVPLWKSKHVQS